MNMKRNGKKVLALALSFASVVSVACGLGYKLPRSEERDRQQARWEAQPGPAITVDMGYYDARRAEVRKRFCRERREIEGSYSSRHQKELWMDRALASRDRALDNFDLEEAEERSVLLRIKNRLIAAFLGECYVTYH